MDINQDMLDGALKSLFSHPTLKRAPQMRRLLEYLAVEELARRGDRLTGYKVGVEALRKPNDFDPSSDASVRVEIGRLRRILAQYYFENPDEPVVIEIPKGASRLKIIDRDRQLASIDHAEYLSRPTSMGPSIALLPLEHNEAIEDAKLLAMGLREELVSELTRFREFHFVDASGVDPRQAPERICAHQLECEFMLASRLITESEQSHLRVTATDIHTSKVIWTNRFQITRINLDIIEVAMSIAHQIAHALARPTGALGIAAVKKRLHKPIDTWNATDCILRWHLYRLRERGPVMHKILREKLRKLLKKDPGFALGYVMFALLKIDEVVYRLNPEGTPTEALERAAFLITQAIGTDPDSAFAYYVKAQCNYFMGEYEDFLFCIDRALELHPHSVELQHHCGAFLCFYGDWDRGLVLLERAGMKYHPGVGYRLAHLIIEYFKTNDPEPGRMLLETTYIPEELSVANVVACLIQIKAGNRKAAEKYLIKAIEIEHGLKRELKELVPLWFAHKPLADKILQDLSQLEQTTGVVIKLR
tara:strand:+ start:13032 stop:14633 length:1602 start_codon:yes stop_codon:yes gene_type:complete